MVCSCVVPCKLVWLQIIFCSCVIGTTFSREKLHITSLSCQEVIKIGKQTWWWSNDKTIIKLGYRKISWFVSVSQINYLLATDKSRYFAQPRPIIVLSFDHQVCFHILVTSWQLREVIYYFSLKNMVPITHEQNIICSKTRLDGTTHEQTIICWQLFAGHVVDSQPLERKKKAHRMIMLLIWKAFQSK